MKQTKEFFNKSIKAIKKNWLLFQVGGNFKKNETTDNQVANSFDNSDTNTEQTFIQPNRLWKRLFWKNKQIKEPMTLCIAWKEGNNVQFWSDSRLNYPNGKVIDMAVKVVSFPVKITELKTPKEVNYENKWGICFAGGGQTIYFIKDFILENLQNLEYYDDLFKLSSEKIVEYINKIYVIACNKFLDKLRLEEGGCAIITTGLCPKDLKFKTFLYSIAYNKETTRYESIPEEILIHKNYYFIGSGKSKAQTLFDSGVKHPYQLMKKTIEDDSVPSVGGQIQFGENVNLDFKIKGVGKIDETSGKASLQLRGVDLYDDEIFNYETTLKPGTKFLINFSEME